MQKENNVWTFVYGYKSGRRGGLVASTLGQEVQVQAIAGVIVLCSWARHLTVKVPLHPGV